MPRTARSRSADGATMAALLPPSSSSSRPNRPATRGATARPMRVEPVALSSATRGSSTSACADLGAAQHDRGHGRRRADPAGRLGHQRLAGQRGEQGLLRWLPDHRVAADEGQRGVPRPHRDREVEGADHADDAQRVPLLHHPVARPLGGDREAEQLPRQADGQVADVDHLLDLAQALGADLAGLDGDQRAEVRLVLAQQVRRARGRAGRAPGRARCARSRNASCAAPMIAATSSAVCDRSRASSPPVMGERATRSPSAGNRHAGRPRISDRLG